MSAVDMIIVYLLAFFATKATAWAWVYRAPIGATSIWQVIARPALLLAAVAMWLLLAERLLSAN